MDAVTLVHVRLPGQENTHRLYILFELCQASWGEFQIENRAVTGADPEESSPAGQLV
jgi:hypothetical protein